LKRSAFSYGQEAGLRFLSLIKRGDREGIKRQSSVIESINRGENTVFRTKLANQKFLRGFYYEVSPSTRRFSGSIKKK
jgi:hypothetical protein